MIETVVGEVPMRIFPQEVRRLERVFNATLVATTEAYSKVNRFEMALGRFLVDGEDQFDEGDAQRYRNVIVLGSAVAEELFPFEEVLGQSVVMNKAQYVVVGVMKDRLPRTGGSGEANEDFNKQVFIPIRTCRVRFGERVMIRQGGSRTGEQVELHQVTLTVSDIDKVRSTGELVSDLLKRNHTKKDWEVSVPLDRLKQAEDARDRYLMLMAVTARDLALGGRHRHHEHHAGDRDRADARDRHSPGPRSEAPRHHDAVPDRGGRADRHRRAASGSRSASSLVFGVPPIYALFAKKPLPALLDVSSIFYSLIAAVVVGVAFGMVSGVPGVAARSDRSAPAQLTGRSAIVSPNAQARALPRGDFPPSAAACWMLQSRVDALACSSSG